MAFVDYDSAGDPFVNVSHRVGKTGDWDDLYAVQAMLEFLYAYDPTLKKTKPTKGPVTVTGKPAADTPILIAHFQKVSLKRPKPQGYINKAVGTAKEKMDFTIWRLNSRIDGLFALIGSSETVISYLKRKYPLLASSLRGKEERYEEYSGSGSIIHPPIYQ
jgi:hypothetical protein